MIDKTLYYNVDKDAYSWGKLPKDNDNTDIDELDLFDMLDEEEE